MQKNLTCRSARDAQKNMMTLGVVLVGVNLVFLVLGAFLYGYMAEHTEIAEAYNSMDASVRGDRLFPLIALSGELGSAFGILFILGLIAAAYSSADSALTALTTSTSVDIFRVDRMEDKARAERFRKRIHIVMTLLVFFTILLAAEFKEQNVIGTIFAAANYTYGPLLGLFFFGITSKRSLPDNWAWLVCLIIPAALFVAKSYESELFGEYQFGYELLGINGILCYLGLWGISKRGREGLLDDRRKTKDTRQKPVLRIRELQDTSLSRVLGNDQLQRYTIVD
jgi:Na+/proline symporter